MLPDIVNKLLKIGHARIAENKKFCAEEIEQQKKIKEENEVIKLNKQWNHLLATASVDLELVFDYVDKVMPKKWKCGSEKLWLPIRIPDLSVVMAEYTYCSKNNEFTIDGFAIYRGKFWDTIRQSPDGLAIALAMAESESPKETVVFDPAV